jgi:hypothetical protein
MSCSNLPVTPNDFEMGSQETLPLTFDTTPILLPGETVGWAQATLTQIDNGQDYSSVGLIGPVAIAGNDLTATVTSLAPRKRYLLVIQFEVAANKVWAPSLTIDCPE